MKYLFKGNCTSSEDKPEYKPYVREYGEEWIATTMEDIRKAKELIDHVRSFPDGSFLLPSKDDKNKCVDQSVYGRFDGMQKHELLSHLTKSLYRQHKEIREILSNPSRGIPREFLDQAEAMLGDIIKSVKFEDSQLMTLDEIIEKLIEAKDKWKPQKQVGIYYLGMHKSEQSGIKFTIWGDEIGKVSYDQ